jgi:hypothetical protein
MLLYPNISVIIPSNHGYHELVQIVQSVCAQTVKPAEILIVDSLNEGGACPEEVAAMCVNSRIKLIYEHRTFALPGYARNIGLAMAEGELIAFIDVQTIPRRQWLEECLVLLDNHNISGVWGATSFSAGTWFEQLVKDSFYGVFPIKSLPGSVFKREVFDKAGQFIGWVRAGEDTEWMLRVEVLRIPVGRSTIALVDYVGLIGSDMNQLLKKWYRNYMASRSLSHFFPQKMLLWLVFYPLLVLVAFNWNYLFADWRMDSPLYIGHVTKLVAAMPGIIYVILRGLVFPLRRGVGIWRLLPARFVAITLTCLAVDVVKILVFSVPKRKHDVSTEGLES